MNRVIFCKTGEALVAGNEKASSSPIHTRLATPYTTPTPISWARAYHGKLSTVAAGLALMGYAHAQSTLSSTALPTNGVVSTGSATIGTKGATMTIQQNSDKASINWSSFNVGSAAAVNIQQKTSNDVLLNRVVGNDPSQIMGKINANGKVLLVNPNGIVFGKDGTVRATAFTASTFGVTDEDFKNGNYKFSRNGSSAGVVNHGSISTEGEGNYVALVGATVTNDGRIAAQKGDVVLAAGESVGLPTHIGVPVGRSGRVRLQLSAASINAAVSNTANGVITTEGGQVLLQAAAVGNAIANVVMGGTIDTTAAKGGAVTLQADHGVIKVNGSITANSTAAAAGGDIMIGRDAQTEILAKSTDVSNARLESKGGFVETSGDYLVTHGAKVKAKDWLLDPTDIEIVSSITSSATPDDGGSPTKTYQQTGGTSSSQILRDDIATNLQSGTNVTIKTTNSNASAPGNITVKDSINANSLGGDATLTLQADNKIIVEAGADITLLGTKKLVLDANGGITLFAALYADGGTITMKAGAGSTSTHDFDTTVANGNSTKITADKLELLGTGAIFDLRNVNNSINTLAADTGTVMLSNNKGITIGKVNDTTGITASGRASVSTSGAIAVNADITAATGVVLRVGSLGGTAGITAAADTTIANYGTGGIELTAYKGNIKVGNITNTGNGVSSAAGAVVIAAGYDYAAGTATNATGTTANVSKLAGADFYNEGNLYIYTGSYDGFGSIEDNWNTLTKNNAGFSNLYANNPYKANNVGFNKAYYYVGHTRLDMPDNPGATNQVVFRQDKTVPSFGSINLASLNGQTVTTAYGTDPSTALTSKLASAMTTGTNLTASLGDNTFNFDATDVLNDIANNATLPALTSANKSSSGKRIVGTYDWTNLTPSKTLTGIVNLTAPTDMKLTVAQKEISVSSVAASESIYGDNLSPGAAVFAAGAIELGDKVSVKTKVKYTDADLSTGQKVKANSYFQSTDGLTDKTDASSIDSGNYKLVADITTSSANYQVKKKGVSATIADEEVTYGTNKFGALSLGATALVTNDKVTLNGTVTADGDPADILSNSGFVKARDTAYKQKASGMSLSGDDASNYELTATTTTTATANYLVNKKKVNATITGVQTTYGTAAAAGTLTLGNELVDGDKVVIAGTVTNEGANIKSTSGFIKANPGGYAQTATAVELFSGDGKNDADNYELLSPDVTAANSYKVARKAVAASISGVNVTYGTDAAAGALSLAGDALVGNDQVALSGVVSNSGANNRSSAGFIKANATGYDQTASGMALSSTNSNDDAANYTLTSTSVTAAQSYRVAKRDIPQATIDSVTTSYGSNAASTISLGNAVLAGDQVSATGTVALSAGSGGSANIRSTSGSVKASDTAYDQTVSNIALTSGNGNNDADNYNLVSTSATAAQSYKVNKKDVVAVIAAVTTTYGTDAQGALSLGDALVNGDQLTVNGTVTNSGANNRSTSGFVKASDTPYDQTASNVSLSSANGNNDADNYNLIGTSASAARSYTVNKKVVSATIGGVDATYGTEAAVGSLSLASNALVGNDQVALSGVVSNSGANNRSTAGFIKANTTGYDQTASNIVLSSTNSNDDAANYTLANTSITSAQSYKVSPKLAAATISPVTVNSGSNNNTLGTLSLGDTLMAGDQVNVTGNVSIPGVTNLSSLAVSDTGYDQVGNNVAISSANANNDAANYRLASTTVTAPGSYKVNRSNTLPNVVPVINVPTAQTSQVSLSTSPSFNLSGDDSAFALSSANLQVKKETSSNLSCTDFHLIDKSVPANSVTVCRQSNN